MSYLPVRQDFLQRFQRLGSEVAGIESGSIAITRAGGWGAEDKVSLALGEGWRVPGGYSHPFARLLSSHIQIFGAVEWYAGVSDIALHLPTGGARAAPWESYSFLASQGGAGPIVARALPDGTLHIPHGSAHPVILGTLRWPAAEEGG